MYGIQCHYHQVQEEGLRANAKLSHEGVNGLANTSHQHQANNQGPWEDSQPSATAKQTRLKRWTTGHKGKAISETQAQSANFLDDISDPTIWLSETGKQAEKWRSYIDERARHFHGEHIRSSRSGWEKAIKEAHLHQEGWRLGTGEPLFKEAQRNMAQANRYNLFNKGMTAVKIAGKVATGYSYVESGNKIATAQENERLRVIHEKVGRHIGEGLGGMAALSVIGGLEIAAPIISTPIAISVSVAAVTLGGEVGVQAGSLIYEYEQNMIDYFRK